MMRAAATRRVDGLCTPLQHVRPRCVGLHRLAAVREFMWSKLLSMSIGERRSARGATRGPGTTASASALPSAAADGSPAAARSDSRGGRVCHHSVRASHADDGLSRERLTVSHAWRLGAPPGGGGVGGASPPHLSRAGARSRGHGPRRGRGHRS